ncbi:MAG: hypothetical protein QXN55_01445 [Candidatus Nitrosotenuis sp.]
MNFLADIEELNGKKRYQSFLIEMGIEKTTVLIPLSEADAFEAKASETRPKTKAALSKLVTKFNGLTQD